MIYRRDDATSTRGAACHVDDAATDISVTCVDSSSTRGRGGQIIQSLGRLVLAALSGLAVGFAFQPYALWPLGFLGVAGLSVAVHAVPPRRGFAVGYVFGVALLLVAMGWVRVIVGGGAAAYLGVVGLIGFEAVFFGLLGLALAIIGRLRSWPVIAAAAWVGVEYVYARYPFGGFGWTRLAYTAVDAPLAGLLPFIGTVGVSFAVALLAQCVGWLAIEIIRARRSHGPLTRSMVARTALPALATWSIVMGTGLALSGWNPGPPAPAQKARVGIVQGNVPGKGVEALGRMRTVTANHVRETRRLINAADQGRIARPDFVLWPENSTDIDPTVDPITRDQLQSATELAGVPIFAGAVMAGPGVDQRQTSGLWWDPRRGIVARYDKRNLVPFGEWIPFRDRLLPLFPILKLVGAQSVPGTRPGALPVPLRLAGGPEQPVIVGDAICFELAYDDTIYDVITGGAQLFLVQSNNATYVGTGQVDQQFAITRARAMETRREIAVATTNGVSGFIGRDGRAQWKSRERTAASTVVTMPLRTNITPAVRIAPWLERGLALLALSGCLTATVGRGRARRSRAAGA